VPLDISNLERAGLSRDAPGNGQSHPACGRCSASKWASPRVGKLRMELLVQPRDGLQPVLKAIRRARKSIEIVIFRFDQAEVRHALVEAVQRGVAVRALISYTNRGGEKKLRKLESDFLANGIIVARTSDDLPRYHGKMLLVDRKRLYVLSYNFTSIDLRSRGFALATNNARLVREAVALFDADCSRQAFRPNKSGLIVSPLNARAALENLIRGAKRELLIWELKLTDREMLRLLRRRAEEGVRVRVLGKVKGNRLRSRPFHSMRLHTRTIVCDRDKVFVGSQSMRKDELDARREIGVIVRNRAIAAELAHIFDKDWHANSHKKEGSHPNRVAKKVAQQLARELPVGRLARAVATKRIKRAAPGKLKRVLRQAVREAAREALLEETVA
jgi:cardiolipin synthase